MSYRYSSSSRRPGLIRRADPERYLSPRLFLSITCLDRIAWRAAHFLSSSGCYCTLSSWAVFRIPRRRECLIIRTPPSPRWNRERSNSSMTIAVPSVSPPLSTTPGSPRSPAATAGIWRKDGSLPATTASKQGGAISRKGSRCEGSRRTSAPTTTRVPIRYAPPFPGGWKAGGTGKTSRAGTISPAWESPAIPVASTITRRSS